jgi:nucleoside-diphosphate-sugar epimerase
MSDVYLVTGAAGFIGSKTAEFLLRDGHQVVGIDNLNDYYDPELKNYRLSELKKFPNFVFFLIDIEKKSSLDPIFKKFKFKAVLNLAARAGVGASMKDPEVYVSTNTMGTLNLLNCCRDFEVKKFVLASTSSLYAGLDLPFTEDLAVNTPISPYAASKKGAEVMSYTYHYLYGIDVSVVRYFTVFGPAGRPDMSIYIFTDAILNNKTIEIFGSGEQSRDFTFVDDIARGTIRAVKPVGFEVINLGGGRNPVSLKKIISTLENLTGKKTEIIFKPSIKADMDKTWADISKAEKLLGWKPEVSLEDGLAQTIHWHQTFN